MALTSTWAAPFYTDDNFDAVKIESGDALDDKGEACVPKTPGCFPSYSKVYKIKPVDPKKPNVKPTAAQRFSQIKEFLEKDFLVKYDVNIGVLADYKAQVKKAKGFSISINDVK